jgi:hypothetical protein
MDTFDVYTSIASAKYILQEGLCKHLWQTTTTCLHQLIDWWGFANIFNML